MNNLPTLHLKKPEETVAKKGGKMFGKKATLATRVL